MLDVIADFWKPAKKNQAQEPLKPEQLQTGSSLGFGFVPQAILSGRRLYINGINTYQFGEESLTSFVLTYDKETTSSTPGVSMIVAESEGEHYLAISRRIPIADREKLFDKEELNAVMGKPDATTLTCRDHMVDFKGWTVSRYKREIHGLKGRIFKGDYRKTPLPNGAGQDFEYTLLVSDNNEHAIEIEKYSNHIEVYTTVYRRVSDIGEITHPVSAEAGRPDIKLASAPAKAPAATPAAAPAPSASPVLSVTQQTVEATKPAPIKLQEFPAAPVQVAPKPEPVKLETKPTPAPAPQQTTPLNISKEKIPMEYTTTNGAAAKTTAFIKPHLPENFSKQEVKAVTNNALKQFENDAIECDLRVANKIIDEAIRNEMRLTDIVRRIIELPVAYPESVQIPVSLTDEDYALLAIRYGIPTSDRNSIKRRIIEDLNDFSGDRKKSA